MADDLLARLKKSPLLCDGAMGTLLYSKGIFINRCYDELNLSQPDLIGGIHHEYLQAGAEIIETDPLQGSDGAQTLALEMARRDAAKYFYADQYNNDANWRAHYESTGPEIWEQTGGRVTHFVTGLGTCGTFTGVGRRLKELQPSIRLISMEPDSPIHGLEGLKHLPTSRMPGLST